MRSGAGPTGPPSSASRPSCRPSPWRSSSASCSDCSVRHAGRDSGHRAYHRAMTVETRGVDAALAYLRDHADDNMRGLDEFLRIESVSADPERKDEVRRTAQWVADELTRMGVDNAELHETSGHPIVTGDWLHAGEDKPTVLVYCHYDVQPPDPLDEWIRPPFEPRYE